MEETNGKQKKNKLKGLHNHEYFYLDLVRIFKILISLFCVIFLSILAKNGFSNLYSLFALIVGNEDTYVNVASGELQDLVNNIGQAIFSLSLLGCTGMILFEAVTSYNDLSFSFIKLIRKYVKAINNIFRIGIALYFITFLNSSVAVVRPYNNDSRVVVLLLIFGLIYGLIYIAEKICLNKIKKKIQADLIIKEIDIVTNYGKLDKVPFLFFKSNSCWGDYSMIIRQTSVSTMNQNILFNDIESERLKRGGLYDNEPLLINDLFKDYVLSIEWPVSEVAKE